MLLPMILLLSAEYDDGGGENGCDGDDDDDGDHGVDVNHLHSVH